MTNSVPPSKATSAIASATYAGTRDRRDAASDTEICASDARACAAPLARSVGGGELWLVGTPASSGICTFNAEIELDRSDAFASDVRLNERPPPCDGPAFGIDELE